VIEERQDLLALLGHPEQWANQDHLESKGHLEKMVNQDHRESRDIKA